jgi:signal transduction histidine kinase
MNELLASMSKVERGDLDARLPFVAADEIGAIASHFNSMLDGLHERQRFFDENERLVSELQASRGRIVAAADAARRRIERDLHDGAQQNLVLLNLKLGQLRAKIETDPDAAAMVDELREELKRALDELRDLAHGIYPSLLVNDGLPGALAEAAEAAAIPTSFSADGAGRYPAEVEAAVYFCCLEALQNAAKHAGASARARVSLSERGGTLAFEVSDDGAGCDLERLRESTGLQGMSDRVGSLGGELSIDSRPGGGTTVRGAIPVGRSEQS